jgi:hypothetical protein
MQYRQTPWASTFQALDHFGALSSKFRVDFDAWHANSPAEIALRPSRIPLPESRIPLDGSAKRGVASGVSNSPKAPGVPRFFPGFRNPPQRRVRRRLRPPPETSCPPTPSTAVESARAETFPGHPFVDRKNAAVSQYLGRRGPLILSRRQSDSLSINAAARAYLCCQVRRFGLGLGRTTIQRCPSSKHGPFEERPVLCADVPGSTEDRRNGLRLQVASRNRPSCGRVLPGSRTHH